GASCAPTTRGRSGEATRSGCGGSSGWWSTRPRGSGGFGTATSATRPGTSWPPRARPPVRGCSARGCSWPASGAQGPPHAERLARLGARTRSRPRVRAPLALQERGRRQPPQPLLHLRLAHAVRVRDPALPGAAQHDDRLPRRRGRARRRLAAARRRRSKSRGRDARRQAGTAVGQRSVQARAPLGLRPATPGDRRRGRPHGGAATALSGVTRATRAAPGARRRRRRPRAR
ncbi:MAG: hypothetical protein QOG86_1138, partial [Thermoleophilaceae bacterium]|nr:hypothetical protein [Thermoleophilaceae bacterium]